MGPSAPLNFDQSQQQVEGMMERGTAFAHVEDAIDTAPLAELHKAALWLLRGRCATACSSVRMRGLWWLPSPAAINGADDAERNSGKTPLFSAE